MSNRDYTGVDILPRGLLQIHKIEKNLLSTSPARFEYPEMTEHRVDVL